ncbi:MAG: aminopeptidase N [Gammaproteobacteria bacterium]|nr:aminopeptidase N [Gammaproteobacteria bacterium]
MSKEATPGAIYLKDYIPPTFWIDSVNLRFELGEQETRVVSEIDFRRNFDVDAPNILELHGEQLVLGSVFLDGRALSDGDFSVSKEQLWIPDVPDQFTLQIETFIKPQENTSLEGLYKSSGNFCTQCEAEGFRKITYYLDRPDVMAKFTTTIVADQSRYPVLLSNGNPVDSGELENGQHFVSWEDPYKKPCYLFALVAGQLECVEDTFTTMSGREIALRIYVEQHNVDKCAHAMRSLQKAMSWDEQKYGREYDLDIYMIVAVDDFNMGAMENKGLNVFNSKFVLAKPETATDVDFVNIEAVIGHEYFHNWSGNRVTCRDWFQLTLKEGLTVFRDQQFTADMSSATVKRIDDVNVLRTRQFVEDAGPMAHPIQPDSYVEINNFYTVTVYNKGAEIIRMIHTLLGAHDFRKGMDLYFSRHDGEAATTEDFVKAMEDASDVKLQQFRLWYHQAGTPELQVSGEHSPDDSTYTLSVKQQSSNNKPFHIPLSFGLIDEAGNNIPHASQILNVTQAEQSFVFNNISSVVVPSILRNFSAPVKLQLDLSDDDLAFLMANDSDEFNRWNSAQQLAVNIMLALIAEYRRAGRQLDNLQLPASFVAAFGQVLTDAKLDAALAARVLTLPAEDYLAEMMNVVDVDAIHDVREFCKSAIARELQADLIAIYRDKQTANFELTAEAMGQRSLKNLCLAYLVSLDMADSRELALQQYEQATNMTDQIAALSSLVGLGGKESEQVLGQFYAQWKDDALVIDKWFTVQATAALPQTLDNIGKLLVHEAFDINVPNRVRALLGAFSQANPVNFHDKSGQGYQYLADCVIKLNETNPQIAARLLLPLIQWRRFDEARQQLMIKQLQRISDTQGLAKDVFEIVSRGLSVSQQ